MKTRVLIVDDEDEFADALAERLEIRGFETTAAYSGVGALQRIEGWEPDVVLLDVMMPGLDGTEVLKRIKESHPLIEVVMLTGKATVESAIEGMRLGAYDFLFKPAGAEVLEEKIGSAAILKREHENRIREAEVDNLIKRVGW